MTNKFKFGDKVSYRSCKNAFYLQETDDIRSLIAVEKFGAIKGAVITVITNELTPASGWVKCADKSPPFNTYVLIWDGEDQDVDWLSDTAPNEFKESHITHWMPLPAPPVEVVK